MIARPIYPIPPARLRVAGGSLVAALSARLSLARRLPVRLVVVIAVSFGIAVSSVIVIASFFFCLFDCILLLLLVAVVRVGFFYEKSIRTLPMRWRSAKPHKRDCFLRARLYANVSRERG